MIRITQEYDNLNQKNGVIKKQSYYSLMCDETEDHAEKKNPLLCFSGPFLELPESALTQIPTHFRESSLVGRGTNLSGLRVFLGFLG